VFPGQRNFENTVYALEASDNGLTDTILKIDLLQNVSPEKSVRESAQKALQSVEKQLIRIERDPKIWQALKDYEQGAWRTERATLKKDDQKLFRDIFLACKRIGFDLSVEKQKRLKEIEERLAKISNMFRQNSLKYIYACMIAIQRIPLLHLICVQLVFLYFHPIFRLKKICVCVRQRKYKT